MATITTLRPSATSSGVGWTAQPSGALHEVTSDDNDATYAEWSGSGSAMILATPLAAPPVGERRHLVRIRARGEGGWAWWAVRLATGQLVAGAAGSFGGSPETVTGSWQAGAPADGSTTLFCFVEGQSIGLRIVELFLDVDTRAAPTFTPQILDGSGTPTTTITDTVTPTARVSALDLDGLPARQYRYWVTDASSAIVWDTGVVSGPAVDRLITPLDNGTYTLHQQVWSTLGENTAYASVIEELEFTMAVGAVPAPNPPVVTPEEPFYRVKVCAPDTTGFDDQVAWIQLQRVDCPHGSQRVTTLAILGPLASDECDEWVDFTIPRSGVGRTCDHDPEPCCSYYRARTVGRVNGSILVSDWSDAFNPGIPPGVIFMWPGTNDSIPQGWRRVTALDGRYTKGIPDSLTQPGTIGGSATHSHTTPGHVHSLDHFHTTSTNTGAAQGTFQSHDGSPGSFGYPSSHTHTRPSTDTASVNSQSASPGTSPVANDPARLEVIWIESTGTPLGVPDGALALMPDISPPGWDTYADATGRFLKGAPPAGDGGATAASQIDSHTHEINSHTHGGTSHTHTSAPTGFTSGTLSFFAGPNTTTWTNQHQHNITIGSANTGSLQSASGGTSGSQSPSDPPYRNLRVRQNNSGAPDLPVGLIAVWRGSLDAIPDGWELCDGNNGTPDLTGRYPRGAETDIGDSGGGLAAHTHTSPSHSHAINGHSHSSIIGPSLGATADISFVPIVTTVDGDHTHSSSNTDSEIPTVGSSSSGTLGAATTEPPFEEVAFIQLQAEPEPPPEPENFCLEWSEDEHLIRTYGPDGPMYFGVWGMFEWGVERPFTAATGVMGSRFVSSAPPGGRNLRMVAAVESEAELAALRAVLSRPLVLISPSDSSEVWAAPVAESIRVVKIGRIREVRAEFIATGPEPEPQVADVGV